LPVIHYNLTGWVWYFSAYLFDASQVRSYLNFLEIRGITLHTQDNAEKLNIAIPQSNLIHGDARCHGIAAASIVAKVTRDREMDEMDKLYPQYKFSKNKGYGTKDHIEALLEYGPCQIHRKSFIKKILDRNQQLSFL